MGIFSKKRTAALQTDGTVAVQTKSAERHPFCALSGGALYDMRVYKALREGVPIIDSAVNKIVRLMGGFEFSTGNEAIDREMNGFFELINVGGNQTGIQSCQ